MHGIRYIAAPLLLVLDRTLLVAASLMDPGPKALTLCFVGHPFQLWLPQGKGPGPQAGRHIQVRSPDIFGCGGGGGEQFAPCVETAANGDAVSNFCKAGMRPLPSSHQPSSLCCTPTGCAANSCQARAITTMGEMDRATCTQLINCCGLGCRGPLCLDCIDTVWSFWGLDEGAFKKSSLGDWMKEHSKRIVPLLPGQLS